MHLKLKGLIKELRLTYRLIQDGYYYYYYEPFRGSIKSALADSRFRLRLAYSLSR